MPAVSNVRKSSTTTNANMPVAEPRPNPHVAALSRASAQPRRTSSGRAVRTNTTRPTNYYARPYASTSNNVDTDAHNIDSTNAQPPGFFPGLQFLSDAITALPKEVMRQFTLMKEVEAKIHEPNDKLSDLIERLLEQPVPTRRHNTAATWSAAAGQGLMNFTASNSANASAAPSLINGLDGRQSAQASLTGSVIGEEAPVDVEEERRRRAQYKELRDLTRSLNPNLDEKNMVLSGGTRVLRQQQTRIDSVWPQIELEISEEARYGSMTHWAYADNRQKKPAAGPGTAKGRDIAAANSLAAAANVVRETEIAQVRRDAGREATREKAKGKRAEPAADSDFDDKPKKTPKIGRGKAAANAAAAATGLGISTNGEPATKRKKTEKAAAAPTIERTASVPGGRGAKGRETPRSTPAVEPSGKKTAKAKPGPPKGKKLPLSAQASPMLASSPLAASFAGATMEPPNGRPQIGRLRGNSSATNLRHERLQDEPGSSQPPSAAGKAAEKANGKRRVQETTEVQDGNTADDPTEKRLKEAAEKLKSEDTEMPDARADARPAASQSGSSHKNSLRGSKVGSPRQESSPAMDGTTGKARTTRSRPRTRVDGGESSSSEPLTQSTTNRHQRVASNSHLVKQLMPFNRSPDMDRRQSDEDENEDGQEVSTREKIVEPEEQPDVMDEDPPIEEESRENRRASARRPTSRKSTGVVSSPMPVTRDSTPPASPPPPSTTTRPRTHTSASYTSAPLEAAVLVVEEEEVEPEAAEEADEGEEEAEPEPEPAEPVVEDEEEEEDEEEHDPDDPNEMKYCYCQRGSYGEMVACDNEDCPVEWFHLGCTELRETPAVEEKWYCTECRPRSLKGKGRGRGGRA